MWPSAWDPTAWKVIGAYMAFELALMRLVPGKTFTAMVTATGHVPKYTANGMQCYALSIAALMYLMQDGTVAPGAVYETVKALRPCRPSFVSVTYGAGGSTRDRR